MKNILIGNWSRQLCVCDYRSSSFLTTMVLPDDLGAQAPRFDGAVHCSVEPVHCSVVILCGSATPIELAYVDRIDTQIDEQHIRRILKSSPFHSH